VQAYLELQRTRPSTYDFGDFSDERSGWTADSFALVGSFNDWTLDESCGGILTVSKEAPVLNAAKGDMRREEFQIVGDGRWEKRVFPGGGMGAAVVAMRPGQPAPAAEGDGSQQRGHGRNWAIDGLPGTRFRINYNPASKQVTCEQLESGEAQS